ncbi:Uncharacterised protein [Mycobacteroides abscessus subsp. abscessus]|nr:Uncharacterised protein [Mycobacteroides abscessus subsp. abscessus]
MSSIDEAVTKVGSPSSGNPSVTAARTALRPAWLNSTSNSATWRPCFRTITSNSTSPGSGADR